jgi:hypothetical protein
MHCSDSCPDYYHTINVYISYIFSHGVGKGLYKTISQGLMLRGGVSDEIKLKALTPG